MLRDQAAAKTCSLDNRLSPPSRLEGLYRRQEELAHPPRLDQWWPPAPDSFSSTMQGRKHVSHRGCLQCFASLCSPLLPSHLGLMSPRLVGPLASLCFPAVKDSWSCLGKAEQGRRERRRCRGPVCLSLYSCMEVALLRSKIAMLVVYHSLIKQKMHDFQ